MKLRDLDNKELDRRLKILKNFKLKGYDVFLFYGTLLGSVREQKLIGHDDDIDLAYLSKYHTKEEIKKEMLEIYKELNKKGILIKYFDLNYDEVFDFENMVNGLGQCHIMIDGFIFDLFTTWVDQDGDFNTYEFGKITKATDYFPLELGTLHKYKFKIPKNAKILLKEIYGEDWEIPQEKKSTRKNRDIYLR
jgi:phosphorylcholine metabolism protein LicD